MLIEEYFQKIEQTITQSCIVVDSMLIKDKRSLYLGFIEGTLTFIDDSTLHFIEFVNVTITTNRYKYSYHYQDDAERLVFRYDMAPHHRELSTFPHHKHTQNGQTVDAIAPSLSDVLEEIGEFVI